jgi:hypothetical protein
MNQFRTGVNFAHRKPHAFAVAHDFRNFCISVEFRHLRSSIAQRNFGTLGVGSLFISLMNHLVIGIKRGIVSE